MLVCYCSLVVLMMLTPCIEVVISSQLQSRSFQNFPSFAMFPVATRDAIDSLSSCVYKCLEILTTCASFIYYASSQTCYLGSWLLANDTTDPIAGAEYFSTGAKCEDHPGFTLMSSGNVATCVSLSLNTSTFTNARLSCAAVGAHLYTFRSQEKFSILRKIVADPRTGIWIGLDDIVREGVYVWADDNSVLTSAWLSYIFIAGQPNNYMNQDCILYDNIKNGVNDEQCGVSTRFLCELDLY